MKKYVIILSKTNPFAYENRRMRRALEALGIETVCCDPGQFAVTTGLKPGLTYKGLPFHTPDLVIVRTGSGTGTHTVTVLRAMVGMGIIVINPISAIQTAMDKVATAQLASDAGLLTPKTLIVTGQSDVVSAWTGGYPCIVKLASGSGGRGVLKCESPAQLKSVIQLIFKLDPNRLFLIQEYLGDRPGADLRVWVIGYRAVCAMLRQASNGDFRAGISAGGTGQPFAMTDEIIKTSETIARLAGLELGGIDLLWQGENFAIAEINSAPAFKGLESFCGIDIAAKIGEYVSSRLNPDCADTSAE